MKLQETYNTNKQIINQAYMTMYTTIQEELEQSKSFQGEDLDSIVLDLILSNVLGEIITFDKVKELINNNK